MRTPAALPSLVNWDQVHGLFGDAADAEQRRRLVEMWVGMREDVESAWDRLFGIENEAELRCSLHALRGLVSMWGLAAVAGRMLKCEKGPGPLEAWRRERGELTLWLGRSFEEIERGVPGLAVARRFGNAVT